MIQPSFSKLSQPDFVNQSLVWLYLGYEIKSEVFVHTLRTTENMMELEATRDLVSREISRLQTCDSVTDDDDGRLQLNSLQYLKKVIDTKISRLQSGFSGNSYGLPANIDWSGKINPNTKLFNLPLEVILKNNIALSYFIDFMTSINCQHIVFFYLNIEAEFFSPEVEVLELYYALKNQLRHPNHPTGNLFPFPGSLWHSNIEKVPTNESKAWLDLDQ